MPTGPNIVTIDHIHDLKMREKNGVIMELRRRVDVSGLVSTDYGVLLEALVNAGVPTAGMPLVAPNLRRLHPFGMLVLVDRDVTIDDQDNSKASIILEYKHFMEQDNQDISQMSLDIPSWRPTLPLGAAQGPPGAYIGWFSVFGKNETNVQQTKTNFGYRRRPVNDIPEWKVQVTIFNWDPLQQFHTTGNLVRFNGVVYVNLQQIGVNNPPPRVGVDWRVARPGIDYTPNPYPVGTVVRYRNLYWINTEAVTYGVPGVSSSWRIARAGADYPVVENSREKYLITLGHKFPDDDQDVAGKTIYQTGEITVMDPNNHYTVEGQVFTAFPWKIADGIIARINKFPWMNGKINEWMCTEVAWTAVFVRRKYTMKFKFQKNLDGWQPTAVFVDRRTGKPPTGLVQGFGYDTVDYHEPLDFNWYFQSNFEL